MNEEVKELFKFNFKNGIILPIVIGALIALFVPSNNLGVVDLIIRFIIVLVVCIGAYAVISFVLAKLGKHISFKKSKRAHPKQTQAKPIQTKPKQSPIQSKPVQSKAVESKSSKISFKKPSIKNPVKFFADKPKIKKDIETCNKRPIAISNAKSNFKPALYYLIEHPVEPVVKPAFCFFDSDDSQVKKEETVSSPVNVRENLDDVVLAPSNTEEVPEQPVKRKRGRPRKYPLPVEKPVEQPVEEQPVEKPIEQPAVKEQPVEEQPVEEFVEQPVKEEVIEQAVEQPVEEQSETSKRERFVAPVLGVSREEGDYKGGEEISNSNGQDLFLDEDIDYNLNGENDEEIVVPPVVKKPSKLEGFKSKASKLVKDSKDKLSKRNDEGNGRRKQSPDLVLKLQKNIDLFKRRMPKFSEPNKPDLSVGDTKMDFDSDDIHSNKIYKVQKNQDITTIDDCRLYELAKKPENMSKRELELIVSNPELREHYNTFFENISDNFDKNKEIYYLKRL